MHGSVKVTTYQSYGSLVRLHLSPTLGHMKLSALTPAHVQRLYRAKLDQGFAQKIVSEMLGHSSVSITLDIYSHVIPGLGDAAALAMEDALGDDPGVGGVGDVGGEAL